METSRSLLWQSRSFSFLILFTLGTTLGNDNTNSIVSTTTIDGKGMTASKDVPGKGNVSSTTSAVEDHLSPSSMNSTGTTTAASNTSIIKDMNLKSNVTSEEPLVTKPLASHAKVIESTTLIGTTPTTVPGTVVHIPKSVTSSGKEISTDSPFVKLSSDRKVSAGITTPISLSDLGNHTEDRLSDEVTPTVVFSPSPSKEPSPGQIKEEKDITGFHKPDHVTEQDASSHNHPRSTTTLPKKAPQPGSPSTSPSTKNNIGIIVTVVIIILVILAILAFLYVRHRQHSGSTSFPGWAGQATIPDDTGLDGDVEQGEVKAGEGETKRSTLVSSFGKRQSRVPSIAMEDIKGKGEREETQQLIETGAGGGANLEGPEEANGNLKDTPMPSSGEAPTSGKPGGGVSA